MAGENVRVLTSISAGEDLNTSGHRYHAIALDDGKLANNAEEASGILLNKPKTGEGLELGYSGEMKFAAGGAISAGGKITVATSGWFTSAGSSDVVVGECKDSVTSGSLGTGLFSFPTATAAKPENLRFDVTAKGAIIAGVAIDLVTGLPAAEARDGNVVAQAAASSGSTLSGMLWGKGIGRMSPAANCSLGDNLTSTTSGYFTKAGSGYYSSALALANIGSNSTGDIFFFGAYAGYKPTSYN